MKKNKMKQKTKYNRSSVKKVEKMQPQNFNKTLVIGHSTSDKKSIMALLNAGGMSIAKPLQQQSIEATEISKILSQTYNPNRDNKKQYNIDKVWDGLALDLFMSNRNEKWWGWDDAEALPYLSYWKSIDSKLGFIFVYDTPENFLKTFLLKSDNLSSDIVIKAVEEWCEYNEALLKFYYRNMENSLLVNTQQVKYKTTEYLQQVSKQIGFNHTKIDDNVIVTIQESFENDENEPLFSYIIDNFIKEYPNLTNIFEELQSVATLPFNVSNKMEHNSLEVLLALKNDKEQYNRLLKKMSYIKRDNVAYQSQISYLESEREELLEQEKSKSIENKDLLAQLLSVQEELEKYYLINQKEIALLEKSLKDNEKLKTELDFLQKKYNDLVKSKNSKASENEELLSHLMSVQEELEKYYLENKRFKEKQEEAHRYYGAAERVKKQLRYRVGKEITQKYKSILGIITLPFSLVLVYIDYKKDKKKINREKLPPISEYADAYEVPRIKRHHAYRVGDVVISSLQTSSGFFAIPYRLIKLYKEFKKERNDA